MRQVAEEAVDSLAALSSLPTSTGSDAPVSKLTC